MENIVRNDCSKTNFDGHIPTYKIQNDYDLLLSLSNNKPSKRIVKSKKGLKAIKALIDLEKNHNVSWYSYLKKRSRRYSNKTALFYRGNRITYSELIEKGEIIAKSLVKIGVKPSDEIPICMTNTPELVYILIAINKIGAKANIFGEQFNHEYIQEILNGCSSKVIFSDDSRYDFIKDVVENKKIENIVVTSLSDSIPDNVKECKDYEPELADYYNYPNKVDFYKKQNLNVLSFSDIERIGKNSNNNFEYKGNLETDFLITYTSGSTIIGKPKAIVHKNRSLIVSGRFHDCELSGNPDMKEFSCLAHIPPESNTDLIACISDILLQGWTVCLEPEYDHKKALDYIMLNKPNYLNMTTSFFIEAAKQYLIGKKFRNRKLDFIFTPFAVGEKLSPGEEKFINKFLRVSRAGSAIPVNGFKFPFITLGAAAGDCEHGAIFYTLWKKFSETKSRLFGVGECGLYPEAYVNATVLKKNHNGEYEECDYGEFGLIVSNSFSNMDGYKNNPDATENLLVTDNLGRTWLSCNTCGYIDKLGGVHVKGRKELLFTTIGGKLISLYKLEELITKDTKKVLSCQVIQKDDKVVAVIQPQFGVKSSAVISSVKNHILNEMDNCFMDNFEIVILPFEESFPLTHSGKRELLLNSLFNNEEELSKNKTLKKYKIK